MSDFKQPTPHYGPETLEALTRADLIWLERMLAALGRACTELAALQSGVEPRVTLLPGDAPVIEMRGVKWPAFADGALTITGEGLDDATARALRATIDIMDRQADRADPQDAAGADDAAADGAGVVLPPAPSSAPEPETENPAALGAVQVGEPVAAVGFPPVPAATGTKPAPWTTEQDQRLIEGVAKRVAVGGLSWRQAAFRVAPSLGRPEEDTFFRAKTVLKEQITARINELSRETKPAAEPEQTDAAPDPKAAVASVAVVAGPAAEVVPAAPAAGADAPVSGPVVLASEDCLAFVGRRRSGAGWDIADDLLLLRDAMAGIPVGTIAGELDRGVTECRARIDRLTGFDSSTKQRKFSREAVLLALTELQRTAGTQATGTENAA